MTPYIMTLTQMATRIYENILDLRQSYMPADMHIKSEHSFQSHKAVWIYFLPGPWLGRSWHLPVLQRPRGWKYVFDFHLECNKVILAFDVSNENGVVAVWGTEVRETSLRILFQKKKYWCFKRISHGFPHRWHTHPVPPLKMPRWCGKNTY